MIDLITRVFPPPLLLGIFIYGLICFLWLQPLTERRLAETTYVPQCEARHGKPFGERMPVQREPATPDDFEGALDTSPEATADEDSWFAAITGGTGQLYEDMAPVAASHADLPPCACSVMTAFDQVQWPMLVHVMTLRTYVPHTIASLDRRVDRIMASGMCR